MKIAVAFFGIPRSSSICFPTIEKNILGALPSDAEVACYYHLYLQHEVTNPRSGESGFLEEADYAPFLGMTGTLEEPDACMTRWHAETLRTYGDAWGDGFYSFRNLIHQLNSIHQVTKLLQPFEPDFVVYARPDLYYHSPLPRYAFSRGQSWRRNVYVPNWQWWYGINDRFAVCGSDIFQAYGFRIQHALEFCQTGKALHGERLLRYAMKEGQARIRTLGTKASRVRTGGRFHDEKFSALLTTGGELPIQILNRASRVRTMLDRLAPVGREPSGGSGRSHLIPNERAGRPT